LFTSISKIATSEAIVENNIEEKVNPMGTVKQEAELP